MLYILGITGSIGCGKSTVTGLLAKRGALTLDADQLARATLDPGSPTLVAVAERFGSDLLTGDGPPATRTLNRALLAERIFSHPEKRRQLEALIHPRVFAHMAATLHQWDRAASRTARTIAALEIPLLLETDSDALCDGILVVTCGDRQQERLATRPGLSPATRQQIIAQQLPESLKCRRAHWIIDNRHDPDSLDARLTPLWSALHALPDPDFPAWPSRWHPFLNSKRDIFSG